MLIFHPACLLRTEQGPYVGRCIGTFPGSWLQNGCHLRASKRGLHQAHLRGRPRQRYLHLACMRDALDIGKESLALRERYGMTLFGQACRVPARIKLCTEDKRSETCMNQSRSHPDRNGGSKVPEALRWSRPKRERDETSVHSSTLHHGESFRIWA